MKTFVCLLAVAATMAAAEVNVAPGGSAGPNNLHQAQFAESRQADTYGAPAAPLVDSYGAPSAPSSAWSEVPSASYYNFQNPSQGAGASFGRFKPGLS